MLFAALVGTACSAWGAMESETIDFNSEQSSSLTGSIQQFDPSKGTLTAVDVIFSVTTTTEALIWSSGAGNIYSGVSVYNGTESIDASFNASKSSDFVLSAGPLSTESYSGTTKTGGIIVAGSSPTPGGQTFTPTDWSSFVGTGTTAFNITATSTASVSGTDVSGMLFFGSNISSLGTIEVEYFYTPNGIAVPEASQFPLFTAAAAGLVGMGGLVRRIRHI